MLQKLQIALVQIKAGKTSENFLGFVHKVYN